MSLVVPNVAEVDGLSYFLNMTAPEGLVLRLFSNNVTPAETDTAASYTEAAGFGYAAISLVPSQWSITQGNPAQAVYPAQSFVFTGALGALYGYFITRAASGRIAWAERFATPQSIGLAGDKITVVPAITLE